MISSPNACMVDYRSSSPRKHNGQNEIIPFFVIWGTKEDILPEGGVLDPGRLTHIADAPAYRAATI